MRSLTFFILFFSTLLYSCKKELTVTEAEKKAFNFADIFHNYKSDVLSAPFREDFYVKGIGKFRGRSYYPLLGRYDGNNFSISREAMYKFEDNNKLKNGQRFTYLAKFIIDDKKNYVLGKFLYVKPLEYTKYDKLCIPMSLKSEKFNVGDIIFSTRSLRYHYVQDGPKSYGPKKIFPQKNLSIFNFTNNANYLKEFKKHSLDKEIKEIPEKQQFKVKDIIKYEKNSTTKFGDKYKETATLLKINTVKGDLLFEPSIFTKIKYWSCELPDIFEMGKKSVKIKITDLKPVDSKGRWVNYNNESSISCSSYESNLKDHLNCSIRNGANVNNVQIPYDKNKIKVLY